MATGDTTISIAVEGGVTKSVVLDSATRVLSRGDDRTDVDWAVSQINRFGGIILIQANQKLEAEATWTPKTFTAAT